MRSDQSSLSCRVGHCHRQWAARGPRSGEHNTRSGEKENSFGHFGLQSHFHAHAKIRIWPSSSDWLIFLQTRKSIPLVRLIGNTEGTVGIFVTALLVISPPGKEFVCKILQLSVYKRSRFACVSSTLILFLTVPLKQFVLGPRGAFSNSPMCSALCQPDMESQL